VDYRDKKCGKISCNNDSKCIHIKSDTYVCIKVTVHGGWSGWNSWGGCSVTCGSGTRTRIRSCDNPSPRFGGQPCSGESSESSLCNTHNCPVHGMWSGWSIWGSCSITCGGGQMSRSRNCDNPPPMYGGQACSGQSSKTSSCNSLNCPSMFYLFIS
ncbi:semaphorin-5A-like, partial [Saccostrea cucullata]|uniref:semaphorin-5A-like n=1 Tax=Saccostrea cuccullata TaxID=36930 RepID=UPI002ED48FE8